MSGVETLLRSERKIKMKEEREADNETEKDGQKITQH